MKVRALPSFVLPLLLAPLAATSPPAEAQSINRCEARDGTTIFTDKSCAAFGAVPAGGSGYDAGALAGELRDPPENLGRDGATGGFAIKGCARTQGELIAGVRGAIESGDVNRLTNYYHWTGVSASGSVGLMDRLDRIVRNTMSGVQFDYESAYDYSYSTAAIPSVAEPVYAPMPVADVVYTAGPSYMDRYRPENDDAPILSSGIVEASTPLEDVLPEIRARVAAAEAAGTGVAVSAGIVDASTPLDEARALTMAGGGSYGYPESRADPKPVALRVNNGGGGGTRFSLRQNAGCWFIQF